MQAAAFEQHAHTPALGVGNWSLLRRRSSSHMTQPKPTIAMSTGVEAFSTPIDRMASASKTLPRVASEKIANPDFGRYEIEYSRQPAQHSSSELPCCKE